MQEAESLHAHGPTTSQAMNPILFWDPSCLRPYDTRTVLHEAIGGSESSLSRVADALDAFVIQHNRAQAQGRYRPPGRIPGITNVVISRDVRALPGVREIYPDAHYYLWLHDQINPGSTRGRRLASMAAVLRDLSVTIICVSDAQRRGVEATLRRMDVGDRVRAEFGVE